MDSWNGCGNVFGWDIKMMDIFSWNWFCKKMGFCPKFQIFGFVKRNGKWCWVSCDWNKDYVDDDGGVGYVISLLLKYDGIMSFD